jgi:type II restriction enzyme
VADTALGTLIGRWRDDPLGSYRSWFLWDERLKNFRSIRRGLATVIEEIETRSFGNLYKGSSLETVVRSVAEQRQLFRGADHAFLWKPKLRIPDIYESPENQLAFGRFLATCTCCTGADALIEAVHSLDRRKVKGLGPAVSNLLYFLHPTWMPPFNTAIVKGYNAVARARVKLGKWDEYLAMREGMLRLNGEYRDRLSNDLGAIGGLLFDIGSGRYPAPPIADDDEQRAIWTADLERARRAAADTAKAAKIATDGERTHTEMQGWLRDLGRALGFDVWIAANDRSRPFLGGRLDDGCLPELPVKLRDAPGADAVRLIDVLWLAKNDGHVSAAFEVEHTTSIYSGIVRLLDLALGAPSNATRGLFLVAPDDRENEVRTQLGRPAFRRVLDLNVRYLPYGELERHRESMSRFGEGLKAIDAVARSLR